MRNILNQLIDQQPLRKEEASDIMLRIANQEFSDVEITAFLTTYLMRAISVQELAGFREALLELAVKVDLDVDQSIDLCGTGGDGKNTFNISTLSAFIISGAGYKVVKHGNYGVSSISGSSNVLEHLGYKFTNNQDKLNTQLAKSNICFLHAPLFHPAMKAVGPARRDLKIKTFFNLLGPLVNPASPTHQLVGVYDLYVARLYQYFLQRIDRTYLVVHGLDGYDEVSLTGPTKVIGNNEEAILQSEDFGLKTLVPEDILGGSTVADAAKIFKEILSGEGTKEQEDVVIANAALAIHCFEPDKPLTDCVNIARESLVSGRAFASLKKVLA